MDSQFPHPQQPMCLSSDDLLRLAIQADPALMDHWSRVPAATQQRLLRAVMTCASPPAQSSTAATDDWPVLRDILDALYRPEEDVPQTLPAAPQLQHAPPISDDLRKYLSDTWTEWERYVAEDALATGPNASQAPDAQRPGSAHAAAPDVAAGAEVNFSADGIDVIALLSEYAKQLLDMNASAQSC